NPIHIGHLIIASSIVDETELKEIWFVVSPQNPFKTKSSLLNEYDRLHLIELAIKDDYRFRSSNIEFNLPKPSYTIDTLNYLWEKHPEHEFSLIMGSDNLKSFNKWKNHETILKEVNLIVFKRNGFEMSNYLNHPSVTTLSFPFLDISATYIREKIKAGKSVKYLIPEASLNYIKEMNFFK
ncbi:MAG: nicotinate (nicotinamide) nucleotide adenylyltransferase, partial [Flavobacteriaceae bacterium]|nr:nicotinate (nicotinamide) nucleotide adenylyltransferase [Flavobacteriaceae bacterium]